MTIDELVDKFFPKKDSSDEEDETARQQMDEILRANLGSKEDKKKFRLFWNTFQQCKTQEAD